MYRYDPVVLVREGVIWDIINLFLGLPLLTLAIILTVRNSLRGRLLLCGLLAYFFLRLPDVRDDDGLQPSVPGLRGDICTHCCWIFLEYQASRRFPKGLFITIPAWIVVPLIQDGKTNLVEAISFMFLCLVGLVLVGLFYLSIQRRGVKGPNKILAQCL
ncbi:MAG: hypothetical protein V3T35_02995 [Spirochaetia bacterium]